jgi:hypothetical protein
MGFSKKMSTWPNHPPPNFYTMSMSANSINSIKLFMDSSKPHGSSSLT